MKRPSQLDENTLDGIDVALGVLLTAYGREEISAGDFILNVGHMVSAVDLGNLTEVATFISHPLFIRPD